MKRRFNYTNRVKITRDKFSIILNRENGDVKSFSVIIKLEGLALPPDAKVYVDAFRRNEKNRFIFGEVGNILQPPDTGLSSFAYRENLKFRILVVDKSYGLILAQVDRISPETEPDRKSILPVDFGHDLGQRIWVVEYTEYEDAPILYINRKISNIENIAKTDSRFFMHVYPVVIKEILTHMVFVDEVDSPSDPSIDWHRDWLKFSQIILNSENPPQILDLKDDYFDKEEVENWINKIVEEFCMSCRKEWLSYISQIEEAVQNE